MIVSWCLTTENWWNLGLQRRCCRFRAGCLETCVVKAQTGRYSQPLLEVENRICPVTAFARLHCHTDLKLEPQHPTCNAAQGTDSGIVSRAVSTLPCSRTSSTPRNECSIGWRAWRSFRRRRPAGPCGTRNRQSTPETPTLASHPHASPRRAVHYRRTYKQILQCSSHSFHRVSLSVYSRLWGSNHTVQHYYLHFFVC